MKKPSMILFDAGETLINYVQVIYKALFDLLNIELSIPMSRVEQFVLNKMG